MVLFAGIVLAAPAPSAEWRQDAKGYDAAVMEQNSSGLPLLVYFHTDWCGYCKDLDAKVLSTQKVRDYVMTFAKAKVNPETSQEAEALARKFGVSGYPSVFVVLPGKQPEKISVSGAAGPDAFIAEIVRASGGAGEAVAVKGAKGTKGAKTVAAAAPESLKVNIPNSLVADLPPDVVGLQASGKNEMAIVTLSEEIKRSTRKDVKAKPALYYARALSYRAMHKHSEAAADLEQYLTSEPDDVAAREVLARSYLNVTLYADAATELETIVKDHPNAERFFLLGEAYSKGGKAKLAKTDYALACQDGYAPACSK